MKYFDFTQLGGFPFTQDALKHMQDAYTEMAQALVTTDEPVIISGLNPETVGSDVNYTAGFVAFNGEVIPVAAGSHHVSAIQSAHIKVVAINTILVYDNGSSNAVKTTKTGEIVQDGTGTFLIYGLKKLHEIKALECIDDWVVIDGGADSYVRYQINHSTKMVQVQGWSRHYTTYNSGNPMAMLVTSDIPDPVAVEFIPFETTIKCHLQPEILTAQGDVYRGERGQVTNLGLAIYSRALSTTYTTIQLQAMKHYFNFSYPIQ